MYRDLSNPHRQNGVPWQALASMKAPNVGQY
jgi:hypothetical protein